MAITEAFTGGQAVGATEWSCTTGTSGPASETSDGVFQVFLDISDMIAGDELQIRMYEKTQSGLTQRAAWQANLVGAQGMPLWVSPSFMLLYGWDFTLKAIAGTITIYWSVRKIG